MLNNNKPVRKKKPINVKRVVLIFVFIIYLLIQCVMMFQDSKPIQGTLGYNELFEMIDNNEVESVLVTKQSNICTITTTDGKIYEAVNPQSDTFIQDLLEHGANVKIQKTTLSESLMSLLLSLPMVVILAMFAVYISNTIIGGSTKMFTILNAKDNNITFDDVKGLTETKKELKFAVEQMTNWKKLHSLGARPCKGILLYGPPGTGKTMLAKAIANEAHVKFISASGSDFNEVFVGVGAARIRSLWELAQTNAPCIIFIDEIDCLGKRRKGGDGAANEFNQTLNCMLQKMDGLNSTPGVMVIGATNMKENLDEALLRPGRFDKQFFVGPPTTKEDRDELVQFYIKNKKIEKETLSFEDASKLCSGLTGAEIDEALNEAVFISLREGRDGVIKASDIDEGVMKQLLSGVKHEHKSDRDAELVAYHESGHTLVALLQGMAISKVTNIPYTGGTGGVTIHDPDSYDKNELKFKSEIEKEICVTLGGRAAELIKYGDNSQGCCADLNTARKKVYKLVEDYGRGSYTFDKSAVIEHPIDIDDSFTVDCKLMLKEYEEKTLKLLEDNKDLLEKLARRLIKERTIVSPTLEKIRAYEDN